MAVVKMEFVNIVGPLEMFDSFVLSHILDHDFEEENALNAIENIKGLTPFGDLNRPSDMMLRLDSLNKTYDIKPGDVDIETLIENIDGITAAADTFAGKIESRMDEHKKIVDENKAVIEKNNSIINRMIPMMNFDVDLAELDMNFINVRFGRMAYENYRRLNDSIKKLNVIVFFMKRDEDDVWLSYYAPTTVINEVDNIFASLYFEKIDLSGIDSGTPAESIHKIQAEIEKAEKVLKEENRLYDEFIESTKEKFKELYSDMFYLNKTAEIKKNAAHTEDSFYLSGWIPKGSMNVLEAQYRDRGISFYFEDAEQMERLKSPTSLKNPGIIKPFEFIVKTYGTPAANEIDPTLFVAITYVLMFGIMFGDVGHGFVLGILGLIVYIKKKSPLAGIIGMCGVSSMIFGFIFGNIFGNEKFMNPLYERPLNNITNMLILAIVFGVVSILIAMVINIINAVRRETVKEMLFDKNGLAGFIFYIGVIIFALVLAIKGKPLTSFLFIAGFFIVPVILMFLKNPLNNLMKGDKFLPDKDRGAFFAEAFFEVFEGVLSFLTNTLSFVRVGAFALSHAGLSLAVWTLYNMMEGIAGGIITLIIGNLLILVLEGLIVGIQGLRLEYYELFSRFFNGEGREFKPMKIKTKSS